MVLALLLEIHFLHILSLLHKAVVESCIPKVCMPQPSTPALDEELSKILKAEKPYLLRDFNAKVGADHDV